MIAVIFEVFPAEGRRDTYLGLAAAPPALRRPVRGPVPPGLDGRLVAEEGERQHLAGLRQAFEALHRYEAVDAFQLVAQRGWRTIRSAGRTTNSRAASVSS